MSEAKSQTIYHFLAKYIYFFFLFNFIYYAKKDFGKGSSLYVLYDTLNYSR